MTRSGTPAHGIIQLDDLWFKRYQKLEYSLADWYIAISKRLEIYKIFNEYFQQKDEKKRKSPLVLSHTGNKKFKWDDFITSQGNIPDDQILQIHVLLQVYLKHNGITTEIATQLRKDINQTPDTFRSFMNKMATMLVDMSSSDDSEAVIMNKINDIKYQLHENESIKTPAFMDDLLLTMNNLKICTDELKIQHFNKAKLAFMKEQIRSGSILDIDDTSRNIIYTNAPYGETYNEKNRHSSISRPVETFTIFNMIQARDKEPAEHVQAVIQMFSEGERSFFRNYMNEEIVTTTVPDEFNPGYFIENRTQPSESKSTQLYEKLHIFGWGYSISESIIEPVKIHRAVCSVNIEESNENILYSFMRWLKHQEKNNPVVNKKINAREARILITDIQSSVERLKLDFGRIAQKIFECENQNLLCYLDYTILTFMLETGPELSIKAQKNKILYTYITNPDKVAKEKLKMLLSDIMNVAFLKKLWQLAYCS